MEWDDGNFTEVVIVTAVFLLAGVAQIPKLLGTGIVATACLALAAPLVVGGVAFRGLKAIGRAYADAKYDKYNRDTASAQAKCRNDIERQICAAEGQLACSRATQGKHFV
jgi:hypothetical protein